MRTKHIYTEFELKCSIAKFNKARMAYQGQLLKVPEIRTLLEIKNTNFIYTLIKYGFFIKVKHGYYTFCEAPKHWGELHMCYLEFQDGLNKNYREKRDRETSKDKILKELLAHPDAVEIAIEILKQNNYHIFKQL